MLKSARMTLFARFFLIMLLFAMTPVIATGIWFLRSNERVEENARRMHRQLTQLSVDSVETSLGRMNRAIAFIEDIERARGRQVEIFKILQRAAITHPAFALISVVDANGKEIVRVADTALFGRAGYSDRSKDPVVLRALKENKAGLTAVRLKGKKPLLGIAHPLKDGRALYAVYGLSNLWEQLRNLQVGTSGRILLTDAGGRPLVGFGEGFVPAGWTAPLMGEQEGWMNGVAAGDTLMVGAYKKTPSAGWRVMTLQPKSEAFAVAEGFLFQALTFLFLLAIIVSAAAYWISRKITAPLKALVQGAQRAARHEFDQAVPAVGWGELNLLSKTFNEMMREIKAFEELHIDQILDEKAKVETLVSTIPDGIIMASFDGKILFMNAAARAQLAANENDTIPPHSTVREVLKQPALRELAGNLMKRRKSSGHTEFEVGTTIEGDDEGRHAVYFVHGVTVKVEQKEVGILLVIRDVTAERDLDLMKEEFMHSIVHDIRGPLGTIDGFVQIMKERDTLPDKEKMYIGYIEGSCDRLRQLVNDILDSAKIESGQLQLKLEAFSIDEFLEHMKTLYTLQTEQKGIELILDKGSEPARPLQCDKELTERVIMNLISNALKFTPKGGKITVHAGADAGEMLLYVEDTGAGIPKDKADLVFEKFKQIDGPQKKSGYGLGLSICKKVVELHGGRIWVDSEEGKGSRFAFRLPLDPPAQT
jgi:signal transduction histidine kinase/HAMP domain-containing protein